MRGKKIEFTEDIRKSIIEKYRKGVPMHRIAREYKCANVRIIAVLKDAGFRLKGSEFSDEHLKDIASRYEAGESVLSIAKAYKCRYYQMRDIIKSLNVKPRKFSTTNTPIERRLHDVLKRQGIGYTTQVRLVDRYVVDIKINQAPVVIEADGETYHRDSNRDAIRDRAHIKAGYKVFRFSGSEINKNAEACIRHVVDECCLTPDKNPVYDIRTTFKGVDHPRWNRITLICINCSNEFTVISKHKDRKFCKQACYHEFTRRTGIFKGGRKPIKRPD